MGNKLIIPDVHGRTFWKDAVSKYPEIDTIFLGDYHDPYPQEGITEEESLHNLIELFDYVAIHPNCQLLLGNHDLHYLCNFGEACRMDYGNYSTIREILLENLHRMKFATTRYVNGKAIVFSHAPILKEWITAAGETDNLPILIENLNNLIYSIESNPYHVEKILGQISPYRGGYDLAGSPIWADAREIRKNNLLPTADFSIFGHTQLLEAVITDKWADLDCRKAFLLSSDIKLTSIG